MNLKKIPLWIVANPLTCVVIVLVITVFFALQIPRLEIDSSSEGLMVENDPARLYYEDIKKKFGSDNLTVIMIKAQDVFTTETLETIQRLSHTLQATPGVKTSWALIMITTLRARGS